MNMRGSQIKIVAQSKKDQSSQIQELPSSPTRFTEDKEKRVNSKAGYEEINAKVKQLDL